MEKFIRIADHSARELFPAIVLFGILLLYAATAATGVPILVPHLLLLAASASLVLFVRPMAVLYLLILVSLFENILGHWLEPLYVGTWRDILTMLILALMAAKLVVLRRGFEVRTPITGLLLLLVGVIFIQIFNPALPNIGMGVFGFRSYFIPILGLFLGLNFIGSRDELSKVGLLLLVILTCAAVVGIIQSKIGFTSYENMNQYIRTDLTHHYSGYSWYRVSSVFGSVWEFGNLMTFMILVTLPVYAVMRKKRLRIPFFVAISLLFTGLISSAALSSIYGAFLGICAYVLFIKKRKTSFVVAAVATVVISAIFMEQAGWERVLFYFFSGARHKSIWAPLPFHEALLENLKGNFFGKGMGISLDAVGARFGYQTSVFKEMHPERAMEGDYFMFMLQAGFPAMILLMAIHLRTVIWGLRIRQHLRDPFFRAVAIGITILVTSAIVTSLFRTFIAQRPLDLLIWFSIGVLFALPRLERKEVSVRADGKDSPVQSHRLARRR